MPIQDTEQVVGRAVDLKPKAQTWKFCLLVEMKCRYHQRKLSWVIWHDVVSKKHTQ